MTNKPLAYPPRVTAFTTPFWDGLRASVFRTTKCRSCSHMTFPSKPVCPQCWSKDVDWVELTGRGVLRSYTEVCAAPAVFADEVPYLLGLVDLDENVRCLSRVLASWDELEPDLRVKIRIRESEPTCLFDFVLDDDRAGAEKAEVRV